MKISVGQKDTITKIFSEKDVITFSEISLDKNPVHLDPEYAETTIFKKPIVHGFLVSSLISAVIGTKLPGSGSIYLKQDLKFLKPVYINDSITATIEVLEIDNVKNRVLLKTDCINQHKEIVISGQALIWYNE